MWNKRCKKCSDDNKLLNEILIFLLGYSFVHSKIYSVWFTSGPTFKLCWWELMNRTFHLLFYCLNVFFLDSSVVMLEGYFFIHELQESMYFRFELLILSLCFFTLFILIGERFQKQKSLSFSSSFNAKIFLIHKDREQFSRFTFHLYNRRKSKYFVNVEQAQNFSLKCYHFTLRAQQCLQNIRRHFLCSIHST